MTSFVSTRGAQPVSLLDAVLSGLAPDGGLYVPARPTALTGRPPDGGSLVDVARWAGPALLPGVPRDVLDRIAGEALDLPTPLVEVETDVHVLELHHGPTCAFKDVGARFLAALADALDASGRVRTVLVATSGDTGGAVAAAFHGRKTFRVVVLFPVRGVSERQRRQMTTLAGNVTAIAVEGTFDDCQRLVKAAFRDPPLSERHALMSANSINVGRLLPQAFYYLLAAAGLGWDQKPARFFVPSGNLGNLCAGLLAKQRGMPSAGFVAATNANRGFADYLSSGRLEPRPVIPTASTAMDVSEPSNLERIRWLYSDDLEALRRDVRAVSVTDEEAATCMRRVLERHGYLLDPHTAVAYEALARCREAFDGPSVVLSTAHPAKFPERTASATGAEVPVPAALAEALSGEERMHTIRSEMAELRDVLESGP